MADFNLAENTDSYKSTHYLQFPPNTKGSFYYKEARSDDDEIMAYGYQPAIKKFFTHVPTVEQVLKADKFWEAHMGGKFFNRKGWLDIVDLGYLPLKIKAVPEGTVVPSKNILMSVEDTDDRFAWLPGWVEPVIMQTWYGTTVATRSYECKKVIKKHLERTGGLEGLAFKLHDFGFRGVTSMESAGIAGSAHLVNFMGTDTVAGIHHAREFYNTDSMLGFSIPAAEHSTITSWGREGEIDAYKNMLNKFASEGKMVAVVSDSYDLENTVKNHWGGVLKQQVIDSGAVVIVRPDSGDPITTPINVVEWLGDSYGYTINDEGYKVLNNVRVIQGDGIDSADTIDAILTQLTSQKWSATNMAFGMGAGLSQKLDRDTYKFAMKCSAINVEGKWRDVYKSPKDAPWKASKRGRMSLYLDKGEYKTYQMDNSKGTEVLRTIFENGKLIVEDTFENIRERAWGND